MNNAEVYGYVDIGPVDGGPVAPQTKRRHCRCLRSRPHHDLPLGWAKNCSILRTPSMSSVKLVVYAKRK